MFTALFLLCLVVVTRRYQPLTLMKFSPLSFAIALANNVFPHPGGPASKMPGGWVKPSCSKCSGYLEKNEKVIAILKHTIKKRGEKRAYRVATRNIDHLQFKSTNCDRDKIGRRLTNNRFLHVTCGSPYVRRSVLLRMSILVISYVFLLII